ncbi:MAG TPA: multicopper oxidase domain-containing protein [Streptosporangiaceae bacterium]|nr:multicopper oxidase domain-containing protein [Streptosporangiaceae bacterium]
MTAGRVSRRQAIGFGVGAAAAGALGGPLLARGTQEALAAAGRIGQELRQPRVLRSAHGELAVQLTTRPGLVDMGAPRLVRTWTYNGAVPGYTWDVRPGDTIRVHLRNRLPELHHPPVMRMDRPHEWTTTNLHTHGLHVSPSEKADNVFLVIKPGKDDHLVIPLPGDHTGGLFWYHPHHHGGVTQALRAGQAGALIVRGEIDRVPEVRAAAEKVMVLQAIELGDHYELLDPNPNPKTPEESFFPRTRVLYTVNGVLKPKVTMYPGEVQRWRILNGAANAFMSLHLKRHDFHVLAWDGLTLDAAEQTDVVMLSSGNRVELLVKAGRPGRYNLVLTPGSSGMPDIPGMPTAGPPGPGDAPPGPGDAPPGHEAPMPGFPLVQGELNRRTILTVEVKGHGREMGLPTALPAFDPPILPIARRRDFAFTINEPDGMFMNFGIDHHAYDPARPPTRPLLGTAEEWTLRNDFDPAMGVHAHVYHIHTNPFKITKRNGALLAKPLWRDTYVLTKRAGDSLTFESNFVDYPGKFVEHCHIVSHEDLGMMSEIRVTRP